MINNNYRIPDFDPDASVQYNCQDCIYSKYTKANAINHLTCNQMNIQVSVNGVCDLIEPVK